MDKVPGKSGPGVGHRRLHTRTAWLRFVDRSAGEVHLGYWLGYYQGKDLMYVARVRSGFVPASRRHVFERICHLVSPIMPFVNLPDRLKSRWGDELTAEKMKECIWLRPEAVAQIEFLEWTAGDRLRHSKFIGLRDDKNPRSVVKAQPVE